MRIRFRFAKLGKVRFTSQRDVARMWERALRRAQLPLAYTEGFSPRPQLSFGLALPTGCESEAEYVDVVLDPGRPETSGVEVECLPQRLSALFPEGIGIERAATLRPGKGSLQQQVTSCSWTMDLARVAPDRLEEQVAAMLAAPTVLIARERKGRVEQDDIRPSVLALAVADGGRVVAGGGGATTVRLVAELATQPRGVRPMELVRGLVAAGRPPSGEYPDGATGTDGTAETPVIDRACRTQQWIERDGIRAEPLERGDRQADVDRAGYALERAS